MSSKPDYSAQAVVTRGYFGRSVGSPPGLPGGGMTGVLPVSGVGMRIAGSTPDGGQSTPSDLANLSPNGSRLWPVVLPSGAIEPCCGADGIGKQSFEPLVVTGGAISARGLAAGGACAAATP
jgi:hypothetical protein